jgi:hypothetical protein
MRRTLAFGAVGVAALATAGGVAWAAGSARSPASAPHAAPVASSSPAPHNHRNGRRHRAGFAGRALHGQFTVERNGRPAVVDVQRGTVNSVTPTSLQVRSSDGFTATYALGGGSRIRQAGQPAAVSKVTVGSRVAVLADDDGGHPTARLVRLAKR